jgi:hypothetical protein
MATTARGIVYPVVGTTLTPLANHFASLATSTNTAIDNAVAGSAAFRGLTSAMGAAGQEGRTYYATDTNRTWFDDGTNWISNDGSMYLIRPTSVVGGTVDASGKIIPTNGLAVSSPVTVNGLMSDRFNSYRIDYSFLFSAGSGANIRLASGGVPHTGTTVA